MPRTRSCGTSMPLLAGEDECRAGFVDRVVRRVAVDPALTAILATSADDQGPAVAADGGRVAELVEGLVSRRLHVRLLRPGSAGPGEEIGGARFDSGVI